MPVNSGRRPGGIRPRLRFRHRADAALRFMKMTSRTEQNIVLYDYIRILYTRIFRAPVDTYILGLLIVDKQS